MNPFDPAAHKAITRAVGEELRRRRDALGLSRDKFVALLPSELGAHSLLAYERGDRNLLVARLVELCHPLQASPPEVLGISLQNAGLYLQNLTLQVDLHELLQHRSSRYKQLVTWAHNKMPQASDGIVTVTASARQEMAALMSCDQNDLTRHLTKFTPSPPQTPQAA